MKRLLSLISLTVLGCTSQAQSERHEYTRWQDPNEQAFTTEIPRGWLVEGGLVRRAAVDTRSVLRVQSPDRRILLFSGDAEIPPFTFPSPMLSSAGFVEGSWYSPGYGVNMLVRRYQPGVEFARAYASRTSCSELQLTSERDRSDVSEQINEIYRRYAAYQMEVRLDAGEVAFTCRQGSEAMAGYVFAGTLLTHMPAGGIWAVEHLYGYLAPADRAQDAETALAHLASSTRLNPEWVRMQQNLTGNVSSIVAETGQHISKLISEAYEYRQSVADETSRRQSNRMLEIEEVLDPQTNQTYRVDSGANYYWIDNLGNVVGTDTHANPDALRFREMTKIDH